MWNFRMKKLNVKNWWNWERSQSYQNLISSFFRFLLLSLSVWSIQKYYLCFKMAELNKEKLKKSSFYEEKSLVGLTPGLNQFHFLHSIFIAICYSFFFRLFFVFEEESISVKRRSYLFSSNCFKRLDKHLNRVKDTIL